MIPAPALPDRAAKAAAKAAGGTDGVVPGLRTGCVFQPWPGGLACGYDRAGGARRNRSVTSPRVAGTIRAELADRLIVGDLLQQFGQHRRICDAAARHFDSPYLQRVSIDAQMNLVPPYGECMHSPAGQRLPRLGGPVFPGEPLAFTLGPDPGAVDQEVQRACAGAIRDGDAQTFLAARQRAEVRPDLSGSGPIEPGQSSGKQSPGLFSDPPHIQKACHQPGRLPRRHCARTNGATMTTRPNSAFSVRQT